MASTRDDEIMRRRAFLATVLVGLAVPPGVLDSAARLEPAGGDGSLGRQVADLEQAVHQRALDFPTTPTIDQLPRLVRDYGDFRHLAGEVGEHLKFRVHGALGQLCAFVGANLSTWQDYNGAHMAYSEGLLHSQRGGAREVTAWIAARVTLMAVQQGRHLQAVHDAAYAVMLSPAGQLGSTLGNALAASTLARMGHRAAAHQALDAARRAVDAQSDVETFTGYSLPWYRLGRFTSETYTALGEFEQAHLCQEESLPAYPHGAATDTTMLRMDRAEAMARQGEPNAAADQAIGALALLPAEHTAPILLDRASEIADLMPDDRLAHAIRDRR